MSSSYYDNSPSGPYSQKPLNVVPQLSLDNDSHGHGGRDDTKNGPVGGGTNFASTVANLSVSCVKVVDFFPMAHSARVVLCVPSFLSIDANALHRSPTSENMYWYGCSCTALLVRSGWGSVFNLWLIFHSPVEHLLCREAVALRVSREDDEWG